MSNRVKMRTPAGGVCIAVLGAMTLAGCAHFQPKPLSPGQAAQELESRSLTNSALKGFLETNLRRNIQDWPHPPWDFDMLTLAAFYYHPDLAVARAQWDVAQAAIKTAGGRPNPTLSLVPGYDTTHSGVPSPWFPAITFDVPIETAGKRGKRIAAAERAAESARFNILTAAWQIRATLRTTLLDATAAYERMGLLQREVSIQERIVELLQRQAEAGAIARSDLNVRRIALQQSRLDLTVAQSQLVEARARAAEAIGIPLSALDDAELSFDPLRDFALPDDLTSAEVRRVALMSRSDILAALADYAAAEATLRLEIAKQYPDVHLSPGYQYDTGDNKWSLGITFDLPILNQNQGPIAEAAARREEAAAKFNALQAKVLAEIERAVEVFRVTKRSSTMLRSLAKEQENQLQSVEAQFKAGAVDQLELQNARLESAAAALAQLDGRIKLEQAAAALEDAVQRPLDMMRTAIQSPTGAARAK